MTTRFRNIVTGEMVEGQFQCCGEDARGKGLEEAVKGLTTAGRELRRVLRETAEVNELAGAGPGA